MNRDISSLRQSYNWGELLEDQLLENPVEMFQNWFQKAIDEKVFEPNVMCLSTVNTKGGVSSRIVLLKDIYKGSFVFYTNYKSKKGQEIEANNKIALNFHWKDLERQVRIEGKAYKLERDISEQYFHSRPYGSQIGALSSNQSSIIKDRKELDNRYIFNFEKYENEGKAPFPDYWGGYYVIPDYFEFWQGRASRLHDRFEYIKEGDSWIVNRLEP